MEKVDKEGAEGNGGTQVPARARSPASSSSTSSTMDSQPSGSFSDDSPVPRDHEADSVVPSGTPPRSPVIGVPSLTMLEGPSGYDPNRIPSSIFASRPSNQADWSVASNESLFSIHTGNNSFSREHTAFLLYKSGELTKLDEVFSVHTPLPPVAESLSPQRDSVDERERSSEGTSPNLGKSPRDKQNKGHLSPSGDARNSASLSARSDGSVTTTSTGSFAFPILAGSSDRRPSSVSATTDGPTGRPKGAPPRTVQPRQQSNRTKVRAALSDCFSCFSCCSFHCNFSIK